MTNWKNTVACDGPNLFRSQPLHTHLSQAKKRKTRVHIQVITLDTCCPGEVWLWASEHQTIPSASHPSGSKMGLHRWIQPLKSLSCGSDPRAPCFSSFPSCVRENQKRKLVQHCTINFSRQFEILSSSTPYSLSSSNPWQDSSQRQGFFSAHHQFQQ